MNWLLRLYPAPWRERYAEEFGAVLASQPASVGLVLDVLAGAIDAHLHPQIQRSHSKPIKGDDTRHSKCCNAALPVGQNFPRVSGGSPFGCRY